MKLIKKTLAFILAMAGLFTFLPPAFAILDNQQSQSNSSAIATIALNVRQGPGTSYNVLDTLFAGEEVTINQCADGWCYINRTGPEGWVAQRFLRIGATPRPSRSTIAPGSSPALQNNNWPNGQFQENLEDPWPGPPVPWPFQPWPGDTEANQPPARSQSPFPGFPDSGQTGQACFFDGNNYIGRSICINSGRSFERLGPRWNDKISSIQVFPNASVTLCENANYGGNCGRFNGNVPRLDPRFNNQASSIMVD